MDGTAICPVSLRVCVYLAIGPVGTRSQSFLTFGRDVIFFGDLGHATTKLVGCVFELD